MKKLLYIIFSICMTLAAASCSKTEPEAPTPAVIRAPEIAWTPAAAPTTPASETPESSNWKIGLITDTIDQNEEEHRGAQQIADKYGTDKVTHLTWPSSGMFEQEYMNSIFAKLGKDPDIKAIIINPAVPGVNAAVDKLKELRNDIFIVYCTPQETPSEAARRANLILSVDDLMMGANMVQQASKMGAKTFVHYSFPRHMEQDILSKRRDLIRGECEGLGLQFIDATAPDPVSDVGVIGAQQFILDDVPKMISEYGKDTAFFCTNCALQIPMIKAVADGGAIYPQPCCPSPYHGFPSALELYSGESIASMPDSKHMIAETKKALAEKNMTGRMSAWPVSPFMMMSVAGAEYAVKWINGEVQKEGIDIDALKECMADYAGIPASLRPFMDENEIVYDNFQLFLMDYITY